MIWQHRILLFTLPNILQCTFRVKFKFFNFKEHLIKFTLLPPWVHNKTLKLHTASIHLDIWTLQPGQVGVRSLGRAIVSPVAWPGDSGSVTIQHLSNQSECIISCNRSPATPPTPEMQSRHRHNTGAGIKQYITNQASSEDTRVMCRDLRDVRMCDCDH